MEDLLNTARCLNVLGRFLSRRDVPALDAKALEAYCGVRQADLLILFGGSILGGCYAAGEAFRRGIARRLMIVGGIGHTTDALRAAIRAHDPAVLTEGRAEADMIADVLRRRYGITDCLLERDSTNCGNNVSFALELAEREKIPAQTVLIMQDSSMQLRMDATFRKVWAGRRLRLINYAAYVAEVAAADGALAFKEPQLCGMWDMDRYIALLMGEIPRLRDDAAGYGPRGRGYIAHVDLPDAVCDAFAELSRTRASFIRAAL